jgi:uncharacterized membrane protein (DUF2068 family)
MPALRHRAWLLSWIVAFKFVKTALLTTLGIVLLRSIHGDLAALVTRVALAVHLPLTSRFVARAAATAAGLTLRQHWALGLTAFAYAALLGTEGVGLHLRRPWARWFTVGATGSLLPIEVFEIVRDPTRPLRFVVFVLNVVVVIYLYLRKEEFHR